MLQALRFGPVEVGVEELQFRIGDQPCLFPFRELGNISASVRPVGPHSPDLGHLSDDREDAVRICRGPRHFFHEGRDVGPRNVGHLHLAEVWDDVELPVPPVGCDGRGLVSAFGIVVDKATEEFLDRRCLSRGGAFGARALALADVGEPVLGNRSSLLQSDFAEAADGGFPPLAVGGGVAHHEYLAPGRRDLQQEPRYDGVAKFVGFLIGRCSIDDRLGEVATIGYRTIGYRRIKLR